MYFWSMVRPNFFAPICIRRFFGAKKAYPLFIFFTFFCLAFFSSACSEDSDPEKVVYPRDKELYVMFPNDAVHGDSVEAHLSTGVMMAVHPGGHYTISFQIDSTHEAPKMQLFRFYKHQDVSGYAMSKMETLKPQVSGGRYVFSFVCEENERTPWGLTLVEDDDYYQGKTLDVKFEGSGLYSDTLSLNLISVGLIEPIEGIPSMDSLARYMLQAFRKSYSTFVIDTIYVNYAEKHPTLGKNYPSDRPWYAGTTSEDKTLSDLGSWPVKGVTEALDIVLVHRIDEVNVLGFSGLFASNLVGGEGSTVVVGSHTLSSSGERSLSAEEIVKVAIHEAGHFFGLRHTTSTTADLEGNYDLSILEDGFEDTPFCPELLKSGLYKKGETTGTLDYYVPNRLYKMMDLMAFGAEFNPDDCPDAEMFMFPVSSEKSMRKFSKQQLKVLKQNLQLIPH